MSFRATPLIQHWKTVKKFAYLMKVETFKKWSFLFTWNKYVTGILNIHLAMSHNSLQNEMSDAMIMNNCYCSNHNLGDIHNFYAINFTLQPCRLLLSTPLNCLQPAKSSVPVSGKQKEFKFNQILNTFFTADKYTKIFY